ALELRLLRGAHRRRRPAIGLLRLERPRRLVAELGEGLLGLLGGERLPVPALLVLEERDALPLDRAGDDRRGPARVAGARERVVDLGEIVSVDDERFPSERLDARGVRVGVPLELGGAALAEAVHVDDR